MEEKVAAEKKTNENRDKKKNMINKMAITNVVLAILFEIVMVFIRKTFTEISIARAIICFGFLSFLGLHYVWGAPTLYNKLVKNRFAISGIMVVISTILGFFVNPFGFFEWFKVTDIPLSLVWNIKFYALVLASYELFYIVTGNKQGLSVIGTYVVALSTLVQLDFNNITPLIYAELIVVLFDKMLISKTKIVNVICALATISISIISTFADNGYTIAFSYVVIALLIWRLIKNKEYLKNKVIVLLTIITLLVSIIVPIVLRINMFGERNIYNDYNGFSNAFNYLNNLFIPYTEGMENAFKVAGIFSLFPVPMLIALYYLYKKEGHTSFLLPVVLSSVIGIICIMGMMPHGIEKAIGYLEVDIYKMAASISFSNLLMIFYFIGNVDDLKVKTNHAIRFVMIVICILVFVGRPEEFESKRFLFFHTAELCTMAFIFMFWREKGYKNAFLALLIILTILGGLPINPLLTETTEAVKPPEEVIYYN